MLPLLFFLILSFLLWRWAISIHCAPHPSIPALVRVSMWRLKVWWCLFFITSYMFDKKCIYVGTWCAFTFCTLSTEQWTILTRSNIIFPAPFLNWSIKSFSCFGKLAFMIHSWRNIGYCTIFNSDDLTEPSTFGYCHSSRPEGMILPVFLSDSWHESFTLYLNRQPWSPCKCWIHNADFKSVKGVLEAATL